MTLDWSKTANDTTLIQALRPLMANRMWFNPVTLKWHTRDIAGNWVKGQLHTYWHHFTWAATQLPDDPYWARSKHRLQMDHSVRQIAAQLAHDCFNRWPKPDDLAD